MFLPRSSAVWHDDQVVALHPGRNLRLARVVRRDPQRLAPVPGGEVGCRPALARAFGATPAESHISAPPADSIGLPVGSTTSNPPPALDRLVSDPVVRSEKRNSFNIGFAAACADFTTSAQVNPSRKARSRRSTSGSTEA